MIDKQIFLEGMGQLGGAFGRVIDGPVQRMYYALLSPKMTNEQFVAAVKETASTERFWPSPAVILEKAGADAETQAQLAWRTITDALNAHGGYRFLPATVSQAWDAPTWAGLKAIGGLREITECTERRWPGLVRDFCKAYQDALQPQKTFPRDGLQPQAAQLIRTTTLALVGRDRAAGERSDD
jgi:hypothetical protein